MTEPLQLISFDVWRARLASLRQASNGLRSLLNHFEALAREGNVARGLRFFWVEDDRLQKVSEGEFEGSESISGLQSQAFEKAVAMAVKGSQALRLPSGFVSGNVRIQDLEGRPWTREDLPLFNATESTHIFLPMVGQGSARACLHVWFREGAGRERVPEMLQLLLDEIARFVESQSPDAQRKLIAEYAVQLTLLESVCGEDDLKDFSIYVTNYVRRLTGSTRVSLFGVRGSPDVIAPDVSRLGKEAVRLRLLGASGLDAVSERSAEAVFLGEVASAMVRGFLLKQRTGTPDDGSKNLIGRRSILVLAPRDLPDPPSVERDGVIEAYFANEPADWLCALALRRKDGAVNGYILCEGKGPLPMFDGIREVFSRLDRPLGRSWERLRVWSGTRARILSRIFRIGERDGGRRKGLRWVAVLVIVGLFLIPVDFEVKGDATLSSRQFRTLSAPFRANLEEVRVLRGQYVAKGQEMGRLRTEDELLRQGELVSQLAALEMRARLMQQQGSEHDAALARIEADVIRAEMALVSNRLDRAVFRAPFDGIVVGPGNYSEREGTLLQEGDPVFELARVDGFSLTLLLREQDFSALRRMSSGGGSIRGTFRPSSDPAKQIPFQLDDLEQLPVYVEDRVPGRFRIAVRVPAEWTSLELGDAPLSESTGKAELLLGRRSLFFVTFRDFIHYLRMNLFL